MAQKVTIIIPTYKRHRQLSRLLEYYSKYDFPILIAESAGCIYGTNNIYDRRMHDHCEHV